MTDCLKSNERLLNMIRNSIHYEIKPILGNMIMIWFKQPLTVKYALLNPICNTAKKIFHTRYNSLICTSFEQIDCQTG